MKKTITAVALLAGSVTAFAQGQVAMNDYTGSPFSIEIFQASSVAASTVSVTYGGYTGFEQQGATVNDLPVAGSTTYTGAPLSTGYNIELLAGVGSGLTLSQLSEVSGSEYSAWFSGSGGGYWNAGTANPTIPGVTSSTTAVTLAIAAWSSTYSTLAAAEASGVSGVWGISPTASETIGYGTVLPPSLPSGITSFSLATTVPEPSTIALGVIGASAFLMRLRRKH
jgi:hypothetical protein